MARSLKLLLLEDDSSDAELLLYQLRQAEYDVTYTRVDSEAGFLQHIDGDWDLIISDFKMPQFDGFKALELARAHRVTIPFILVAGTIGEDVAVSAMKRGATDYLLKDRLARLGNSIEHALNESRMRKMERESAKALAQAEAKYRSIFENSVEGIYQTTPDGRLLTANPALARLAGYDSPQAMHTHVRNVGEQLYVNVADRKRYQENMLRDGFVNGFEAPMRSRTGRIFWISTNARAACDADGNVYFEGALKDITERKEAEELVRATESRLQATLDNMMEGCQIMDHEWRYVYLNAAAARNARRSIEELRGNSVLDLFPGIENTEMFATFRECIAQNRPKQIDYEFEFPDGVSVWFQLGIQPIPEGLFVLSLDITERKLAEQKIQGQLSELQRWQEVMLNREDRMQELKGEVNALLAEQNKAPRYSSTLQPA